ncbi:MAG: rRNA ((527)-N(7))-methyltransferase RsmG [Frankiales bacterium]|nr:rRNA ((527)-N(7))-methyltransferase RsmG [Frankiales bacterium]
MTTALPDGLTGTATPDGGAGQLPPAPPSAAAVFGDRLPSITSFAELLATAGVERGLLGPREAPRLWERHLLNCAGLSDLIEDGQVVLDLGSGAGLPGLVLAVQRPEVQVVLVEPLQRRATFLTEAVEQLGLRNALVRRSRAEELHGKVEVDVVTARAVAPVDRLAGWALPLLHAGGRLLAMKGEQAATELAAAGPALHRAGGVDSAVVEVGSEEHGTRARVVVVHRGSGLVSAAAPRSQSGPRPGGITSTSKRKNRR